MLLRGRPQNTWWPVCPTLGLARGQVVAPSVRVRKGARDSQQGGIRATATRAAAETVLSRDVRRDSVACKPVARGKLRAPPSGHYATLKVRGGGRGRVGKVSCTVYDGR